MAEPKSEILLADDEATFRETFTQVLEEEGFAVTPVCDGREATEAIRKRSYAVAILGIQMPGRDGIRVLREITAAWPRDRCCGAGKGRAAWGGSAPEDGARKREFGRMLSDGNG